MFTNASNFGNRETIPFDLYDEEITDQDYEGHVVAAIRAAMSRDEKRSHKSRATKVKDDD